MEHLIPPIAAFPQDQRIWRVEWIRSVEYNYQVPSEHIIEILIAPFTEKAQKEYESNEAQRKFYHPNDTEDFTVIKIGVGQLPLVKIGSLWRNGRCIKENVGKFYTFDLTINEDTTQELKAGFKESLEEEYEGHKKLPLIPPFQQFISIEGLNTNCIAIKNWEDPLGVILPVPVLISFYYATSTDLSLAVFSGDFQHNLGNLINEDKSFVNEEENLCILHLRRHLDRFDGWIISRILFNDYANKGVRRVHESLMAQKSDIEDKPLHPESNFPFEGKTQLSFYCKPFKCNHINRWRYLIYDIVHCTAPLPYSRLSIDRDNNNNLPNDRSQDLADHEKIPVYKNRTQLKDLDEKPITNEQEPIIEGPIARLTSPEDRFGFLEDKVIEQPDKEFCQYKSSKLKKVKDIFTDQLGTGQGTYGESSSIQTKINTNPGSRFRLSQFSEAIEYLNNLPEFSARMRPVTNKTEFLPLVKNPAYRQWAYLDSTQRTKRSVLIADVDYHGKSYTLIDFQRRKKENYPIGIITQKNNWPLSEYIINQLLFELSKAKGRWHNIKKPPQNLQTITTMNHSWKANEDFCRTVLMKLLS